MFKPIDSLFASGRWRLRRNWLRYRQPDSVFPALASRKVMPWMIGLLVYLATLMLGFALNAGMMAHHSAQSQRYTYTLLMDQPAGIADKARQGAPLDARAETLIDILRAWPEVDGVKRVPVSRLQDQLRPWMQGAEEAMPDWMFPAVIEVQAAAEREEAFRMRIDDLLRSDYTDVRLENDGAWLADYTTLMRSLQWVLTGLAVMILAVLSAVVMLLTRNELGLQRRTVDILHTFGATRNYICRQSEAHMLRLTLKALVTAIVLIALTFGVFHMLALPLGQAFPSLLAFRIYHVPMLLAVIVVTIGVILFSTRLSSLRTLQSLV